MTFFRGGIVWSLAILATALVVVQASPLTYDEAYRVKQKVASGVTLTADETRLLQEVQASRITVPPGRESSPVSGHRPHNPTDDYQASPADYDWVDISTIGTLLPLSLDDYSDALDLGFSFDFYDQSYTQVYVASHGFVTFDPTFPDGGWWVETPLPTNTLPNDAIFAVWDDISSAFQGAIYYYQDTANGRFIASWENISHTSFPEQIFSFEIILYDNGNIVFQYQLVGNNLSCTVGVENAAGDDGLQVCCDGTGDCPIENTAILINQPDGLPNPVSNLVADVNDHDVTLTWLDPTTDTNGNPVTLDSVQIWLGRPGQGIRLGMVLPGTQTFTQFDAPDGNLVYYVRAHATLYWSAARSVNALVGHPSYFSNFDNDDGEFVAEPPEGWQWGPPFMGAHTEPNVWGVGLGGTYPNQSDYYVTLDPGLAIVVPTATFEFWIYYNTENWWDGANLQISVDDGGSWSFVEPPNGYPVPQMWNGEPGWSGTGASWQYLVLDLGPWNGEVPLFRFHFASDPSVALEGFFFDDVSIWGMQTPTFGPVSGFVTLDGVGGNVTAVSVNCNGLGTPHTNPAADGGYTLSNVLVGQRRIVSTLTGYHPDTTFVTVPEGGLTGVNLTLRRLDPPAPTNFSVDSVNNTNGVVHLNWDNSSDPQVDSFKVYRKLATNPTWDLVRTRAVSDATDTLTVDGIYQYSAIAVDYDVIAPPVVSPRSNIDVGLFGELPPTNLMASGNFDDRIHLNWLVPGFNPSFQLAYDDSSTEQWTYINFPNGEHDYFAVRFTPPPPDSANYPLPIQSLNVYLETTDPLPNVWVTPDNGGNPDIENPWMSWQNVGAEEGPGWLTVNVDGQVLLEDPTDFWMVWQVPPGQFGPGTGTDVDSSTGRSYLTWDGELPSWIEIFWANWMARVWVGGEPGWGLVQSVGAPSGYGASRLPHQSVVPAAEAGRGSRDVGIASSKTSGGPLRKVTPATKTDNGDFNRLGLTGGTFPLAMNGKLAPYSQAPALEYQGRHGGRMLDDVLFYKIYRNGTFLVQDVDPPYDDVIGSANENTPYSYYVTAHYDNDQDSPPSNTVQNVRANMAPGAATNLAGDPIGASQMRLTWTDPTVNADATPCVDLASVRVYREGTLIGTVAAGLQQYTDTPPMPDQFYTWSVRGIDEVPNVGSEITFYGAVTSPWETTDYEWIDISQIGTLLPLNLDEYSEALPLGFEFTYFEQPYTQVYVTSHGFVTFDGTMPPGGWWTEEPLPNTNLPNNAIYGLWDDISSAFGGAIYYYRDTAEGRFIAAYVDCGHTGNPQETYTFEIILDDHNGIKFNYQSIAMTSSNGIGVENADGSAGFQILYDGVGWIPTNESAIAIWGGPSGDIQGIVREFGTNDPLEGATVSIAQGPEIALTDNAGYYRLRLDPGAYTVNFARPGYCDTTYTNILVEDRSTTVQNALLKIPQAQFSVTSISLATWPTHDVGQAFQITNNGGQCPLDFVITDTSSWLSTNPFNGTIPVNGSTEIWVNMSPIGLPPGNDYQSALRIQHEADGSPYIIPVTMSISQSYQDQPGLPTEFALYQNYPNPFNATTQIRFDLPQESHVKVTLFNVVGQAVATIVDSRYEAGRHSLSYDATDLPSGMYLMKMEAGSYASMKKMLLLK
jgi:hypothetical protein